MSRVQTVVSVGILVAMLVILGAFIVLPNSGPFDSGVTPSQVSK